MKINYTFKDLSLLETALTHPSFCPDDKSKSYDRLEFFGDKALNLIIAEILFHKFPNATEAQLSVMHSNLANTLCISNVAKDINLGDDIKMDAAEERNIGRANNKVLENAMEALIGAIYLDSNLDQTSSIIKDLWGKYIDDIDSISQRDAKSKLQEWAQKKGKPIPVYNVIEKVGDSHNPTFTIEAVVESLTPTTAMGTSIKQAQQNAAAKLIEIIKNNE